MRLFDIFEDDVPPLPKKKTVAKTWDQMSPKEKQSGVKGRTVWNEKTRKYYTVFDVPAEESVDEVKQRLDPKCWDGYKKQGTKVKGGVRVNNCVPAESVAEGQTPEQEVERLKLRQNAEHGGASLKRQTDTQARIRELEKQIKDKKGVVEDDAGDVEQRMIAKIEKEKQRLAKLKQTDPEAYKREMAKSKTSSRVPPVSTFEDQGVAEGVAETMPMDDAVKVLRHYGAGHFKTTSNELHFYTKNGRGLSVDLVWNDDATRSVNLSSLNSATRALKGQGVAEGSDNITAVFSGYGNYMKGRAANVFKHYGITVLGQQYDEDEDIVEYTVSGSKEALDQARAYLERSDQFGGMIIQQGVAEGLPQTLRKVVPGHAKREIDKKMDAGKFGKTDADKDANFQRYKKIQDKLKEQGVDEAYNNYHANRTGFSKSKRDLSGEGEPAGMFTVMIDGRPWKQDTSNNAFALATNVKRKYPNKQVAVKWPNGQLNTIAEDSWHGQGDSWHGTGDAWHGGAQGEV